jgi:Polysaccharide lyase
MSVWTSIPSRATAAIVVTFSSLLVVGAVSAGAATVETFRPVRSGERALAFELDRVEPATITAVRTQIRSSHHRLHRWLAHRYEGRPTARLRAHRRSHRRLHRLNRGLSVDRVRNVIAQSSRLRLGKPSWAGGGQVRVTVTTPDTTITSGPSGSVPTPDASFSFSSPDANATFECHLDGDDWSTCSTPWTASGLAEGAHAFEVRAVNASGADASPASRRFTVDLGGGEPPGPTIPPSGDVCSFAGITSCTLLKEDPGTQADVKPLWGNTIYCASASRVGYIASPGYRSLSVVDGDNVWGERCEIANNNNRNGDDGGSGTFQLYREGQRKLTSMRVRLPGDFPLDTPYWQSVGQMKQAQPADNGGGTPALALQVYEGKWQLHQSTSTGPSSVTKPIWTAPATKGSWTQIAWDVTYSQDPAKGKIQMFIDLNGDGDALDQNERSPVLNTYTLKRETASNPDDGVTDDGIAAGDSIPSHLRLGIYHDDRISCPPPSGCHADYDDIQVHRVN